MSAPPLFASLGLVAVLSIRGAERLPDSTVATAWARAPLLCVDGRRSPSCTCGRPSYRGCCSGHGGVAVCSAGPSTSSR